MSAYTIRRILLIFPTLLVASILVAAIVRALPGDAVMMTASEQFGARQLSEEGTAIARARMGLDQPFHVQYIRFILGWPKRDGRIRRTQDGGAIWKKLLPVEIEPSTSVEFITNPVGWAAGGRYIFGTILGGTLWGPQKIADHNINALAFADEKRVWAVGDKGMVLHTSNGGQMIDEGDKVFNTWLNQDSGTDQPLRDIFVVDALTVWTVGHKGTILSTVDGGVTWERQASDTDANLLSVAFLDANNGLAVGEKGTILRTTNGGLTWSAGTGGGEGNLSGVAFGGSSKSWAVGKGGLLLQSSDGGVTWSPRVVSFQDDSGKVEELRRDLTSVAFANEKEGFVGGARGTFLATVDGGITWQVHDAGTTRSITDVSVITTSRGQVESLYRGLGEVLGVGDGGRQYGQVPDPRQRDSGRPDTHLSAHLSANADDGDPLYACCHASRHPIGGTPGHLARLYRALHHDPGPRHPVLLASRHGAALTRPVFRLGATSTVCEFL